MNLATGSQQRRTDSCRWAKRLLSGAYATLMVWELFLGHYRIQGRVRMANLTPFKTIARYLFNPQRFTLDTLVVNLVGNIGFFIPLGILLPLVFPALDSIRRIFCVSAGLILLIESAQWTLNVGVFDVDDLILNLLGSLIGYGLLKAATKISRRYRKPGQ